MSDEEQGHIIRLSVSGLTETIISRSPLTITVGQTKDGIGQIDIHRAEGSCVYRQLRNPLGPRTSIIIDFE